jgi:hypothetical protein
MRTRKRFMSDLKANLTQRNGQPLASDESIYSAHRSYKAWARLVLRNYLDLGLQAAIAELAKSPAHAAKLRSLVAEIQAVSAYRPPDCFVLASAALRKNGRISAHFINTQRETTPKLPR